MISVPLAGLLPSTPRPVRFMNGSITSSGKPNGYVGIACGVTIPISSQWPVVVSLPRERSSSRPAIAGAPGCGAQPSSGSMLPEAERLERRQVETSDGAGDVAEGVRPLVTELRSVRQRARADGVQHDHARARHAAILLPWPTSLDCSELLLFIACVIALAAGVTWLVVKISPLPSGKDSSGS